MDTEDNRISDSTFGMELVLDLVDCDPETIRSGEKIAQYTRQLCDVIAMKAYGEPFVERFGLAEPKTAGYSLVQLIETSSITGHFSEAWNKAYINIFSCRSFDTDRAASFTKEFFKAKGVVQQILTRR